MRKSDWFVVSIHDTGAYDPAEYEFGRMVGATAVEVRERPGLRDRVVSRSRARDIREALVFTHNQIPF